MFNLTDFPSVALPLKHFVISGEEDPCDKSFTPRNDVFDKVAAEKCKCLPLCA